MRLALRRACGLWEVGRSGVWEPHFMTPRGAGHPWAVLVPAGAGSGVHGPATEGRTFCKCAWETDGAKRSIREGCAAAGVSGEAQTGRGLSPSVLAGHTLASRKPWLRLAAALHVLLTYVVKQTPWRSLPHLACKRRLAGRPALTCPQGPVGPHSKPFTGRRARGDCRMAEGGNSLAGSGILGSNDPTAFYSTGTGSLEKAGWDTLLGN